MRYLGALFNREMFLFFFSVGLCSHTIYLLQETWRHGMRSMRSGQRRLRGPESTRSSNNHVHKIRDKWRRSKGLLDATWRHEERLSSSTRRPRNSDLTGTWSPIFFSSRRCMDRQISIGRLGRLVEENHDRGAIEPRSRCDRATIVAPSLRNQCHDHSNWIGWSRFYVTLAHRRDAWKLLDASISIGRTM